MRRWGREVSTVLAMLIRCLLFIPNLSVEGSAGRSLASRHPAITLLQNPLQSTLSCKAGSWTACIVLL